MSIRQMFFKTFCTVFFFFTLVAFAGVSEREVTFSSDDLSFTEIEGYDFVKLEGCGSTTREIGAPSLPRAAFSLLIPQGAEVTSVEIVTIDKEEIAGEYKVYPTQHPQPFIKGKVFPFVEPDEDIYAQTTPYPQEIIENPHTGSMGGYRLASLLIYPLQYIPADKKLIFHSRIKFKVTYEENARSFRTKTEKQNKIFKERVKKLILNPEDIGMFEPSIGLSGSLALPPDTVEYVIITADSFETSFQELADWKTKKGVPTKVVTTNYIYSNYTGADNAERVRNFIIDANLSWGTIWVILGGQCDYEWGQEIVPRRNVYYMTSGAGNYPDEDTIPSDLYFSDLDGNWNADGDGVYGESNDSVDFYSDVFVGRAPVRTVAQVETFVDKVLTYEKSPSLGYQKKILLPAAELWPGLYDERLSQEAIANIVPGDWQVSKMYERDGDLTHAAFVDSVQSGFGFAHLVGHGNEEGIYTYYEDAYFDSDDLDALDNDSLLGIHNSIGCMCGALDLVPYGDCFAEHYLTPATGGSYSIMNSRYGWGMPPDMGPSEHIDTCFYHEIFTENYSYHDHVGAAHAFSKDGYVSQVTWYSTWAWCIYELNLFGDPEMPLWTDTPGELTVTHDAVIPVGGSSFAVNVTDGGSGVEDALVCLYKEGEVYERGYTDASGNLTLTLSPPPASLGIMYCTVTKHDYLPYEDSVNVISPSSAWVIFDHYTIIDASGDNDGKVDPGESIKLPLTVHNVGVDTARTVTGILRTTDSYVTITDSTENFGDTILPDSFSSSLEDFDFDVSLGCPATHVVNFELVASDINDSTWISNFSIPILTPDIVLSADTLNFDTVFVGYSDTLELQVNNAGKDTLLVSNITSYSGDYSVDITNFSLPPDETQIVMVTFTPTSEGVSIDSLTVESNDLDEPSATVFLQGEGLEPPDISVSPDSLSDSLLTGETSTDTLTIYNTGGSDLIFDISIEGVETALVSVEDRSKSFKEISAKRSVGKKIRGKRFNSGYYPVRLSLPENRIPPEVLFAQGIRVLIIYEDCSDVSEIQGLLSGFPDIVVVDTWNGNVIPTLDDLLAYDAVMVVEDCAYWDPVALGDVLADYVDAGGGLILTLATFYSGWELMGRLADDGYIPFNLSFAIGSASLGAFDSIHPIMEGVTSADGFLIASDASLSDGAEGVAWWDNGAAFVCTKGTVVGVNIFVANSGYWTGDIPLILHNSAFWSGGGISWLSCDSTSGTISAGDSVKIEVTFDATGLYGGDYFADIIIASNDPDEPEVTVPAHLHVTGAPDIAVSEDTLDYGIVFTGSSVTDTLIIANVGTDSLTVSDVSSDNSDFTVDVTNFTLNPEETQEILVTFTPNSVGTITGLLTIASNDPDEPTADVFLEGECVEPPDISVSPDSLSDSLLTGETSTDTLTIYNTGGSDLIFDISVEELAAPTISVKDNFSELKLNNNRKNRADFEAKRGGSAYSLGNRYTYDRMTLDKMGNLPGNDVNSTDPGLVLGLGDVVNSFSAPASGFIGLEWVNGYLWASSSSSAVFYKLDPTDGTVLDQISVDYIGHCSGLAWDGSAFWATDPVYEVINKIDTSGTVLFSFNAPSTGSVGLAWDGTYLWDVDFNDLQLHKIDPGDGSVLETLPSPDPRPAGVAWDGQYLWINGRDYARTYKIDPSDGMAADSFGTPPGPGLNNGQGAAFDGQYLWIANSDNGMIYQIDVEFVAMLGWLRIDSTSGTVPAGDSVKIEVTFDATGLYGGDYFADIIIASNDPDELEVTVPAHLHVTGAPDIAVSTDTLDYGIVFNGYSYTDTLIVYNEGTDLLTVGDISSDNPDYTVDTTSFILNPEETQGIVVTFTPSSVGTITGLLTIASNDPDEPTVSVFLQGECAEPPDISVSPDSLSDTLNQGETSTHTLTIYNTGVSDLNFDISIEGEPFGPLLSLRESIATKGNREVSLVEIKKGEEDTRVYPAMVLGIGGPDGFGYRWKDSNEPGGPTFDWIDVSSGTSISLSDDDFETGIPLGFTFNYYGSDFTEIGVGSNGWLSFNGSDDWYPSNVPYADEYDGVIAPFARDLYPPDASYIRYQTFGTAPNSYLVIEYNNIPDYGGGNNKTFEIIFYENSNKIRFQYLVAPNDPSGFGIESPDETMGMGNAGVDSLFISPTIVEDNYAIEFSLMPGWISLDTASGTISASDSILIEVTFDATDLDIGDYYADIVITSNDPDEPEVIVPAHLHVPSGGIEERKIPKIFFVKQNYPNPFSSKTVIKYGCPEPTKVCIQIFDVAGRIVNTLVNEEVEAGYYEVTWDGSGQFGRKLANAVYFYRIQAGDFMDTKKTVFLR